MKFKKVINDIKLHLINKKTLEEYYEFYQDYLEAYAFNEYENEYENELEAKIGYQLKNDLEEIVDTVEPWNDVKYFKPIDNQLRELLKKYNL